MLANRRGALAAAVRGSLNWPPRVLPLQCKAPEALYMQSTDAPEWSGWVGPSARSSCSAKNRSLCQNYAPGAASETFYHLNQLSVEIFLVSFWNRDFKFADLWSVPRTLPSVCSVGRVLTLEYLGRHLMLTEGCELAPCLWVVSEPRLGLIFSKISLKLRYSINSH